MSIERSELCRFHEFVGERLQEHGEELSPEECLDLWRAHHPTPAEIADSVAAIKEALEEADRGEGTPLEDFIRSFRAEKGILRTDK